MRSAQAAGANARFQPVAAKPADQREWPEVLLLLVMHQVDETTVFQAIAKAEDAVRNAQTCEAEFFVGQVRAEAGDLQSAADHYRKALATKATNLSAFRGARFELQRLSNPTGSAPM